MVLTYVLFAVGFVLLIKGADWLVEGSSAIAKKFNISDLVIGLTIVAFGTSMPELVVNVVSSLQGSSDIAIGNVLGSNIANILLILGIAAIISSLPIKRDTVFIEIPFSLSAALLVGFLANTFLLESDMDLSISRLDGGILIFFFVLFMGYIVQTSKQGDLAEVVGEVPEGSQSISMSKGYFYIALGVAGLFFGGKWVVDGAILVAQAMGLSESFIGLTVVAVGTSLPELVTSAVAAYKKNTDIAVGNVVGSNIFNLLWVLGVSALINPLSFSRDNNLDIVMIIFSSTLIILALSLSKNNAIGRWTGGLFLLFYAAYIAFLIYRG